MAKRSNNNGNKIIPKKSSRNSKENKFKDLLETIHFVLADSTRSLENKSYTLMACRSISENLGKVLAEKPSYDDRGNIRQLNKIKGRFNNYVNGFANQCRKSISSRQSSEDDVLPTQSLSR